ncbi:MAG: SMC-Scp complex subunit ScpB [Candidatus Eisenbacteria bacterium]|uniref:SMC-Scp complex subunit ScpB n=1 Tax=Eiseniibacteriota bacterium TaxID=2212470 RepID=A0A956M1G7_UNCEI|nr:SMC-Scp complex subunit ScpB [Candidatus Eisenbacteria bacterium]
MTEHESGSRRKRNANLPSLIAIVEAILFASDRPVSTKALAEAVPEADQESLAAALTELSARYQSADSGVGIQELADGFQLTTRPQLSTYVERFLVGRRRARLSRAALETLATIAYRQPITRGEIEDLRGVDCGQVIHTLLTRELITVKGRSEGLGRPLLYGTTPEFLTYFGLRGMGDLPDLDELQALTDVDPLEDPEIREALEASGLLEGLDEEGEDGASPLAAAESDALGSSRPDEGSSEEDHTSESESVKEDSVASEIEAQSTEEAGTELAEPDSPRASYESNGSEPTEGEPARDDGANGGRPAHFLQLGGAVSLDEAAGEFAVTEGNGTPH